MIAIAALALVASALVPAGAGAAPPTLWTKCVGGAEDAACSIPRGIATSASSGHVGHVYVVDQNNFRVVEFDAWGVFVRAWGWDVVASGSGDDTSLPEDQFEICVPANGDVCKGGQPGAGTGQLADPQGVAVDSAGAVYVVDFSNSRVQKFDADGNFVWMIGGDVNKTKVDEAAPEAQQNLCTAASGDACQAGTTGTGVSQFGAWPLGSFIAVDTKATASDADDTIYVGDVGRIQKFAPSGASKGQLVAFIAGESVQSLATDPAGNLLVAFAEGFSNSKENVLKLSPGGFPSCLAAIDEPRAIATDAEGNAYMVDGVSNPEIRKFGPTCGEVTDSSFPFSDGFNSSTGIATGSACLSAGTDIYVSNFVFVNSFVRAYGPAPDKPECPPAPNPPQILAQYAVEVGTDDAILRATINPRRWADTTYFVQYGTAACIEGSGWTASCVGEEPASPALLGAGPVDIGVSTAGVFLEGLAPATTYRYRFVAQSSGNASPIVGVGGKPGEEGADAAFTTYSPPTFDVDCPNQAFRLGAAATLPDCRAYEMVSPVDKGGGDIAAKASFIIELEAAMRQSSPDGNKLTYTSTTAFGDAQRGAIANQYLASRDPARGWTSHGLNPPQGTTVFDPDENEEYDLGINFLTFSEDLCGALVRDHNLTPLTADAIDGRTNLYRRENCGPEIDTYEALTKEPLAFPANVELGLNYGSFAGDAGQNIVFGADAALESTPPAAAGTNQQIYELAAGELRLVSVLPGGEASAADSAVGSTYALFSHGRKSPLERAISEDGSRIFWTSAGNLYVRIDGEETVLVANGAGFLTAATDGSKAIYSQGGNLFEFDVDSETATPIAGDVGGVVGSSEDLSRLYFTSEEALAAEATEGEWNVYLREGDVSFVATVSAEDRGEGAGIDSQLPMEHSSRVTPDGSHLAFMSNSTALAEQVAGYDNADANTGEAASEVYLYDAEAEELSCASCNPSGARPAGRKIRRSYRLDGTFDLRVAAWLPTYEWSNHGKRSLSEDGSRIFFNSYDALALQDTNGAQDVYQWEALGAGSCDKGDSTYSQLNDGCLSLISSGQSPTDSELVDASADGRDVFFTTAQSLDQARDRGSIDIYDARAGGGFPPPPPDPPPCVGDACQEVPAAPGTQTPSSAIFQGPGNERPARNCGALARRAAKLARRAKRSEAPRARRLSKRAKRLGKAAKRCRRANRRAGR